MLTYNTVLVFWCILVILSPLIRLPTPTIAILWSIILAFPVGGCSRNTRIETELCIRHSHRTIRLPWRLCLNSNTFQSRNFWKPKKRGCELKRLRFWLFHFLGGLLPDPDQRTKPRSDRTRSLSMREVGLNTFCVSQNQCFIFPFISQKTT